MLTTHLPFLMGPTMLNLKIDPLIQTSAVTGLGLLFAQTGHTNVVNKLLNEIGKSLRADEEPSPELSAYKLSAGFAIGLICLGLGDEIAAARPPFKQPLPSIPDRLLVLMLGGPRNQCVFIHPQLITCPDVNTAAPAPPQENRSNHVREGPNVNVHMTAHPATIALGLMYMRTGNTAIARELELPATISMLEEIRPDVIFVRVLARSLVLWDMIQPTCEWIDKQIPDIIHEYAQTVLKFPSTVEVDITDEELAYWDEVVDRETIAEVYLYAMTGACFAMALKYSGTIGETQERVLKILEERMQFLMHDLNIESIDWPARHLIRSANRSVVNLCADMMLMSMAILNVGCGKVETIRFARYRRSHDYELSYWSHHPWKFHEEMSVHRALAMLFLGEGRYGFKRDNLSIALLVISMYPIIAHNVADNRLYHQPLRFLWTYSVEPRLLVPMCRKKNKPIQCDVRIDFKDPSCSLCFCTAPMILPPIEELASVAIVGPGVEEVHFDLSNEDRKRDLMEILTKDHGRVPVTVTESCLDDNELAQQEDWTLRQIFDHRVERPCCKVTKLAKELERMKMTNHPGGPDDLRWPPIDSAPAIRQYLKTLHMEISSSPPSLRSFVAEDVKLASYVAQHVGNVHLANRLDIEAQRLEQKTEA
nr:Proteasome cyclosome domain containing protein [Haemonchus contortus]